MLDIIFFAVVAVFIFLRLRSVLGQKNDRDEDNNVQQKIRRQFGRRPTGDVVDFPGMPKDVTPPEKEEAFAFENKEIGDALTSIMSLDKTFTAGRFVDGAKKAFEMIVLAFADEDDRGLKNLLSKDVFEGFSEEIESLKERNQKRDVTLISILESDIIAASLNRNTANITIKFISEQMSVVRDRETGEVVEGDPSKIERVEDVWSFARNMRSSNPNWKLDSTSNID